MDCSGQTSAPSVVHPASLDTKLTRCLPSGNSVDRSYSLQSRRGFFRSDASASACRELPMRVLSNPTGSPSNDVHPVVGPYMSPRPLEFVGNSTQLDPEPKSWMSYARRWSRLWTSCYLRSSSETLSPPFERNSEAFGAAIVGRQSDGSRPMVRSRSASV
ncbi:hypothetical protein BD413DRAFT_500667 [Trametes elegans]|nr:hypothetical protein BD413DRAFT_500667 [Trametes elegans]